MSKLRPVLFRFHEVEVQGEGGEVRRVWAMIPHKRFHALCKRQFSGGEDYALGPVEGVPSKSRAAFFATIHEAWKNLPEDDTRFPDSEYLRKRALVAAGWATNAQYVMDSPKDARSMAMGLRRADPYAVVKCSGNVVDYWSPKSIATGQIHGDEWKGVMQRALDWVATLARTTRKELEENAGAAS